MLDILTPERALAFRIVHMANLAWHLEQGVPCCNSEHLNPDFLAIGSAEIISRRKAWQINTPPFGTLADYVPFYFTPKSMMLSDILQGRTVAKQPRERIVFLVTSAYHLAKRKIPFLFTNQHASSRGVRYFRRIEDLDQIDWKILREVDFRRDPESDPEKTKRYQAELLVYQHLPTNGLLGLAACNKVACDQVQALLDRYDSPLKVHERPDWFF